MSKENKKLDPAKCVADHMRKMICEVERRANTLIKMGYDVSIESTVLAHMDIENTAKPATKVLVIQSHISKTEVL